MSSLHGAQRCHGRGQLQPGPDVQEEEREPVDPNPESLWDVLMRLLESDK